MYAIRYNATLRVCRCYLLCEELASEDKLQTLYNSNASATFVYKSEPSYTHPHPALALGVPRGLLYRAPFQM